jgi:iron complex outermembrane receptor protein
VLDDKLLFTAGARHQKVVVRNYSKATGLESDAYTKAAGCRRLAWCTSRGSVSLYANHTEALQPGSNGANLRGQLWGKHRDRALKQDEVGVKAIYGRSADRWRCLKLKCRTHSDSWQLRPRRRAA